MQEPDSVRAQSTGKPAAPENDRTPEDWFRELAAVVDRINCGLIGRDADDRITVANDRLLAWTDYSSAELLGHDVTELFPPELRQPTRDEIAATRDGDLRARLSVMQRKDSTTFPVLIIPQPFDDEHGAYAGIVSVLIDLGTIQTAKRVGLGSGGGLGDDLSRIALELQSLSLSADLAGGELLALHHPDLEALSPREKEVLSQLLGGARVPAIAGRLHISPHTVRNHLKSMFRKLGVRTQAELIERVRDLARLPEDERD